MNQVIKFLKAEDGQDLIQIRRLLAALIALAAVVAMQATGTSINGVFNSIAGRPNLVGLRFVVLSSSLDRAGRWRVPPVFSQGEFR